MDKFANEIILVSGITSILIMTIFLLIIATGIIMLVLVYQKKQIQYLREKEQLKITFEKEILKSQIEIQEQTLQHISRELHDNVSQVASLIKMNLNSFLLFNPENPREKIEDTLDLTRQLITDIKSISVSLSSDRINQYGLTKAIETEVERLNKTGQFTARFEHSCPIPAINNDKALILYRMTQEILNNIVKHSNSKQINIQLKSEPNNFTLLFQDDGIGFDVNEKILSPGSGLRNLTARAALINARLVIQSRPGTGTIIVIEIPI